MKPIAYVNTIEPYVAVYLGWSSQSRAGQREMERFLDRNGAHLADRRIWVVQRPPLGDGPRGPIRLSRLLVRNGAAAFPGAGSHPRAEVVPTVPGSIPATSAVPGPAPAGDDVVVDTRPVSA